MQTAFSEEQLADPFLRAAEQAIRTCVHCGFCNATCPTFLLLGDERDSPRGRIYLMKDMLENDAPVTDANVRHLDRCLSCLGCRTTCPSGVDYARLIDVGRERIAESYRRPLHEAALRRLLAAVLVRPQALRLALLLGKAAARARLPLPPRLAAAARLARTVRLGRSAIGSSPGVFPAAGPRRARAVLLAGCVQNAAAPEIDEAAIRLLTRAGCEVVVAKGAECCGALHHHFGRRDESHCLARSSIEAWSALSGTAPFDYVVTAVSGCGAHLKDYGFHFQSDPDLAEPAAAIASRARDISEVLCDLGLPPVRRATDTTVAYQAACTLQHGQRILDAPKRLLREAGFDLRETGEEHLCCGSAGPYNLLEPALASQLGARKAANLEAAQPALIASGNIGCILQLRQYTDRPVLHTVQLLDWATGGPDPLERELA